MDSANIPLCSQSRWGNHGTGRSLSRLPPHGGGRLPVHGLAGLVKGWVTLVLVLAHLCSPLGRPGQPAELAPAYVFLASNQATYINGAVLPVTGGKPML